MAIQSGTFDPSFGTGGKLLVPDGGNAANTILQPDGKILALYINQPYNGGRSTRSTIRRFNADGTLDTAFGSSGRIDRDVSGNFVTKMELQNDGSIFLSQEDSPTTSGSKQTIFKYTSTGAIDTTFGNNGTFQSSNAFVQQGRFVTVANGKIVVAGMTAKEQMHVELYNSDGTPVTSFGTNGQSSFNTGTKMGGVNIGFIQADGKLILGLKDTGTSDLIRINTDGTKDTNFALVGGDYGDTMLQQNDGKLVVVSRVGSIYRLNTDGTFDKTFSTVSWFGTDAVATLQSDGKILVGATVKPSEWSNNQDFQVRRYNTDGSLDTTFGTNGSALADIKGLDITKNIQIAPDGRIFVSGVADYQLAVAAIFNDVTAPTTNQAPTVANAIADQNATIGTAFSFAVPANAFSDPDAGDALTYIATLADSTNSPLPSWLTFDASSKTFTGTPPADAANLTLRVNATDKGNLSISDDFILSIAGGGGTGGGETPTPTTGTRRITQAPDGSGSDGTSSDAAISNDGRYVVYRSEASNLVTNDPNGGGFGGGDIFLYDRDTNANTRIAEGFTPDISGNGRYITYDDKILDRDTNTTSSFVKGLNGAAPTSPYGSVGNNATISDDGRYIAYYSHATNLVADDTNNNSDIFLYDRQTDATIKVSSGAGFANVPQISGDGSFIVYGKDENSVYLYDRVAGTNTKISPDDFGTANIQRASISSDNRYITFGNRGFGGTKTLVYDRTTGTLANGDANLLNDAISSDGNYQVRLAPDMANLVPNDNNGFADLFLLSSGGSPAPTPTPTPSGIIPGLTLDRNLFQTDATFKGFGINPVSQKSTQKVSEIALFAVDDLSGKIGGIAPGEAGYLAAVLANAKSIFSTLGGSFFSTEERELALDPNKIYQALEIVDGSLLDAQQQLADGKTPNNLLFSLPDANGNSPIKITNTANGYNLSINNDELVLAIDKLAGTVVNMPIGAKSQSSPQGRTIDLTDYAGQTLKADITTKSDAAYNNQIGFYAVEDAIGTIKLTDGSTLKPGDANYASEAVKLAMTNSLQAGKTDNVTGQDIDGGKIYAPVVIAQGTMNDFLSKNPTNGGGANDVHAYFNYLGANTDKVDHFRLIGNNTFGVEDMYGGGDRDFNDLVIKMNVKV